HVAGTELRQPVHSLYCFVWTVISEDDVEYRVLLAGTNCSLVHQTTHNLTSSDNKVSIVRTHIGRVWTRSIVSTTGLQVDHNLRLFVWRHEHIEELLRGPQCLWLPDGGRRQIDLHSRIAHEHAQIAEFFAGEESIFTRE